MKTIVNMGRCSSDETAELLKLPFYQKALSMLSPAWTDYADVRNNFQEWECWQDGHSLNIFESLSAMGVIDMAVSPDKYITRTDPLTDKKLTIGVGSNFHFRLRPVVETPYVRYADEL